MPSSEGAPVPKLDLSKTEEKPKKKSIPAKIAGMLTPRKDSDEGDGSKSPRRSRSSSRVKKMLTPRRKSKDGQPDEVPPEPPAPVKVEEPVAAAPVAAPEAEVDAAAQDQAAVKLQAIQRGKSARAEQESQNEAAVKVQAIQRGRSARASSGSPPSTDEADVTAGLAVMETPVTSDALVAENPKAQVTTVKLAKSMLTVYTQVFEHYDADRSGNLQLDEFKNAMHDLNNLVTDKEVTTMFKDADVDSNGKLDLTEFVQFAEDYKRNRGAGRALTEAFNSMVATPPDHVQTGTRRAQLQKAFAFYDKDGSGSLDREEFKVALKDVGMLVLDVEVDTMFDDADKDNSNTLSEDEFVQMAEKYFANRDWGSMLAEELNLYFSPKPAYITAA